MNLQQFFNDTLQGGASFNLTTGIYNPNNGYFVSLPNNERQFSLTDFTQDNLSEFIRDNVALLCKDNNFLGSWVENGIVYLDVSEQISDKRRAIEVGMLRNQLAIFDANSSQVISLPSNQKSGTLTQQRAYITSVIDRLC